MKTNFKIKILLLLTLVVLSVGCKTINASVADSGVKISGLSLESYSIDGCEYIGRVYGSSGDFLTHKGNCKFCKQRQPTP